jgi:hypothetical protein
VNDLYGEHVLDADEWAEKRWGADAWRADTRSA